MRRIILTIFILDFYLNTLAPTLPEKQKEDYKVQYLNKQKELFDLVIERLKKDEGFRSVKYQCPAAQPTIGYGHLIKKGEYFNKITEDQADSLLRVDFKKRLKYTDSTLAYNKRLAITKFIYNVGSGNYTRSALKKLVEQGKSIDDEIVKWCTYRNKSGIRAKSKALLRARKFELGLFNLNF